MLLVIIEQLITDIMRYVLCHPDSSSEHLHRISNECKQLIPDTGKVTQRKTRYRLIKVQ